VLSVQKRTKLVEGSRLPPMLGAWLAGVVFLTAGCMPEPAPPEPFRVSRFWQAGERNVSLNDLLVFDFSAELDRISITEGEDLGTGSLRVLDSNGTPARGTLTVHAKQLVFRPRLPRLADLSDGGLRPGTEYTVELVGFPRPDGIRSLWNGPLESTQRMGFRTALRDGEQPLFDSNWELGGGWARMSLERQRIAASDAISIVSSYAIDPRSLSAEEFVLTYLDDKGELQRDDVIALHPRIVENRRLTGSVGHEALARVELVPERALRLGSYILTRVTPHLQNLRGEILEMPIPIQGQLIEVEPPAIGRGEIRFLRSKSGRPDEALGSDGSVFCATDESGASLRLLYAAGDGSDGVLEDPADWAIGSDLRTSRVELEAGSVLDLSDRSGCVVLRAQGTLSLNGSLRRDLGEAVPWSDATPFSNESGRQEALGEWIERMQSLGEPWTVIVAGADLRIAGQLDVAGPLLLVAGGAIRVSGGGRVRGQVVYKSGFGGDNIGQVHDAQLELRAPRDNPLVEPLCYGLLTRPFRPQSGVSSWLEASLDGELGGARLNLQFVGLRDLPGGGVQEVGPVASLDQLIDCQGLRLLLLLTVPAAELGAGGERALLVPATPGDPGNWIAPVVRRVHLSWTPAR
jgi:hypothetical protein